MDDSSTFLQYLPVLVALTAILLTSLLCRWAISQPKRGKGKELAGRDLVAFTSKISEVTADHDKKNTASLTNTDILQQLEMENPRDSKASDLFGGKVNPAAASRAFKTHYATLVMVIPNTLELASDLYSKGVVSRSLMNKLSALGLSSDEKNILLLNEVEGQISLNPNVFQTFVTSLQSIVPLEEMGKKLIESYSVGKDSQSDSSSSLGPLDRFANYLKAYYVTASVSPDYKWPRTPSTQYVNLAIVKKERVNRAQANEFTLATLHGDIDQIMKVKEPIEFEEVLKSHCDKGIRYVLVEGAPGVGKSTFAWELCKRWHEIDALRQYSLVVIIRLRDERVQKATTLSDLFYHTDQELQQAVTQEVNRNDGKGILLIMDGADELPFSVRTNPMSLFAQILAGLFLPNTSILVTSRPSAVTQLVGIKEPDKHIEILGFAKEQIHEYAESIFGSGTKTLYDFERYVSSTPAIKGMLYIPLNTAIVVEVYQENKTKDRPIPNTLTDLYTDLCLLLLQRYLIGTKLVSDPSSLPDTLRDLPQQAYQPLIELTEIAFNGVLEQELVFKNLPEGSKALGFTTASAELFTGRRVTHGFLHLTIQEYLAAFYIAQLSPNEQKKAFLEHSRKDHLDVVWRFFAGITGLDEIGWEVAKSTYSDNIKLDGSVLEILEGSTSVSLIMLRCLFEAQSKGCDSALSSEEVVFSTGNSESFHPFDFFALGYCIAHSNQCSWKVIIQELNLEDDLLEMFTSSMLSNPQISSFVDTLLFRLTPLGQEGVSYLSQLPPSILKKIRTLSLDECRVDKPTLLCLAQLLQQMSSLENMSLQLYYYDTESLEVDNSLMDLSVILHSLVECRNLHSLKFPQGFHWSTADIEAIRQLITPTGPLTYLNISCTSLLRQHIPVLLDILLAESSLLNLKIYGMSLVLSRCNAKLSLLASNSNLQVLQLDDCPLGNRGARVMAEALVNNTSLICLQLNGSHKIKQDGGKALSELLSINKTLKVVKLSFDESLLGFSQDAARAAFPELMDEFPPPTNSRAVTYHCDDKSNLSYDIKE